jgi:hypothetical protein
MALHWPVMENGAAPTRPMLPVTRHSVLMSATVSVPWIEWLTPIVQATNARSARPKRNAASLMTSAGSPHSAATRSSGKASTWAASSSKPEVWALM